MRKVCSFYYGLASGTESLRLLDLLSRSQRLQQPRLDLC